MGISRAQAVECFRSDDLIGLGMEADAVRRSLHPEGVVTYAILGAVSASDRWDAMEEAVRETHDRGGTGVKISSGETPSMEVLVGCLATLKKRFPSLWLEAASASEVVRLARGAATGIADTLLRLRDAGLDSICGGDAGILDDALRARVRGACTAQDWIEVHRTAHRLGLPTSAGMRFGAGETIEQKVAHLEAIFRLQEETGGFFAFIPAAARAADLNSNRVEEEATAVEFLKTLAVARMFLDNIANVEADGATQGLKVPQMTLRFGANDAGALTATGQASEEDLRRVIRDAGFRPAQRDTGYRTLFIG